MMIGRLLYPGTDVRGFRTIANVVSNNRSRKDEFKADACRAKGCGAKNLISALIKLNKENLSEIQVPKIYSVFNYNHPPLLERIESCRKAENA